MMKCSIKVRDNENLSPCIFVDCVALKLHDRLLRFYFNIITKYILKKFSTTEIATNT